MLVEKVCREVRGALEAVAAVHPLALTLTGGRDSRMMLACARPFIGTTKIFTADMRDRTSFRDITLAGSMARRLGLAHEVRRSRSSQRDLAEWAARTAGETGEPRGWRGTRALTSGLEGRAVVTGSAADVERLIGWRKQALDRPVTPELMIKRCAVTQRPEFVARAEAWLAGLPALDPLGVADVFQTEQVNGCWSGVIEYGELGASAARFCPMTSRALVEDAVRLPIEYRLAQRLHHDVMSELWPELLEFPFNEECPLPDTQVKVYQLKESLAPHAERGRRFLRRSISRLMAKEA
jgi:hypothetical protein